MTSKKQKITGYKPIIKTAKLNIDKKTTKKKTLYELLENVLKQNNEFIVNRKLLKNKIIETALKNDKDFLILLMSDLKIKNIFFEKINKNILIFDKLLFIKFINNKQFLPNSYTAFKNKIGLTSNDEFIKNDKNIVISFPYKDCILEGGLTKEDQESKSEVFWNNLLASDEIDMLLEPKVLCNFKRIGNNKKILPLNSKDNLIIRGNNLLALHTIKQKFNKKIKLIYIDPPYNTGNDSFTYNDSFKHSTWLTFMKNRLEVAYHLLHENGSIFISIDQNELGYILVLMDEIFGSENRRNIITIKRSATSGPKVINSGVVNVSEYVIIYSKSENWNNNKLYKSRSRDDRYKKIIENIDKPYSKWKFIGVLDALSDETGISKSKMRKEFCDKYDKKIDEFILKNIDKVIRFADMDDASINKDAKLLKQQSLKQPNKIFYQKRKEDDYYIINGQVILFYKNRVQKIGNSLEFVEKISDIWDDVLPNDLHNEGGIKLRKGKKPEKLIGRIIEMATNPGDIILDFFLGSGTSAAVAHKLDRQYIGIEQINYGKNDAVVRLTNTIAGESSGISKMTNWKGGGSFIYCELMELNQKFIQQIQQKNSKQQLKKLWIKIQKNGFLNYKININKFNDNMIDFDKLDLNAQKKLFIEFLDKNQLFVNLSEINDSDYKISKQDKKLNKIFHSDNLS